MTDDQEIDRADRMAREADAAAEAERATAAEGEPVEMDRAQAARWDQVHEAQQRAETTRDAMTEAAEVRRQAMVAGDSARTVEAGQRWRDAQEAHRDADLEFTSLSSQARTADRQAEREAGQ